MTEELRTRTTTTSKRSTVHAPVSALNSRPGFASRVSIEAALLARFLDGWGSRRRGRPLDRVVHLRAAHA
jgi:hypothetical protein